MHYHGLLFAFLIAAVSVGMAGCVKSTRSNAPHAARPASIPQGKALGATAGLLFCGVPTGPLRTSVAVDVFRRTSSGEWAPPKRIFDFDDRDAVHGVYPSPDGRWVVITLNDKPQMAGPLDRDSDDIVLYSFAKNKLWRVTDDNWGYVGFRWSDDSRYFACSSLENPYSPLATELGKRFVWAHDNAKGILTLVARHATTYGWGPEPNRLLFQKAGSALLHSYDPAADRRTVVGRMPRRFHYLLGRWAAVSLWPKPTHEFYRLAAGKRQGRAFIRAVPYLRLDAKAQILADGLSPDGNQALFRMTGSDRLFILDLARRTLRYFQPPAARCHFVGWSSDGKSVIMFAPAWPDAPHKREKGQIWAALVDSVPKTPVGQTNWQYAHRPKAAMIKAMDPFIESVVWRGPAR